MSPKFPWQVRTRPQQAGGTAAPGRIPFINLPDWITRRLGMRSDEVPSNLAVPDVIPVLEINEPILRRVQFLAATVGSMDTPDDVEWSIVSANVIFISDATAGNRHIVFFAQVRDDNGALADVYFAGSGFTQVASQSVQYVASRNGVVGQTSTGPNTLTASIPLPIPLVLPPRSRIGFLADGLVGADTFTLTQILVEERPERA